MNTKYAEHMDHYERIINLPNTLIMILYVLMGGGALSVIVLFLIHRKFSAVIIALSMLPILGCLLYWINRRGHHRIASLGAFLLTAAILTYIQIANNGLYDVSLLAYPAVIVFSSLLLGTRFVIPITLIMVVAASITHKLTIAGITTPYNGLLTSAITTSDMDYWTIIAAIILTGVLVYIIMSIIEQNVTKILDSEYRIKLVYESTLKGWARALELRDHETEGHSQRVTELTVNLAKKLNITEEALTAVRWGALLHDIGKMSVPDAILLKPGKLTEEEFRIIKEHPNTARRLLENIPYLQSALIIPYGHHERWDGSGYPRGLTGEDIPLSARIFAVIDVWDALRSERPYKKAWTDEEAVSYLNKNAGTLFDPNVVRAFVKLLEEKYNPAKTAPL